jgi:hypothetical protein
MKQLAYYTTVEVPTPNKDDFIDVFVYSKGEVVWSGKYNDFKPFAEGRFRGMLVEKVINEDGLKAQRAAHSEALSEKMREFKDDLFAEYGVTDNPKAARAYALAKAYADDSRDLHSVRSYFEDFVNLIK